MNNPENKLKKFFVISMILIKCSSTNYKHTSSQMGLACGLNHAVLMRAK